MFVLIYEWSDYESSWNRIVSCHEDESVLQKLADHGNALSLQILERQEAKDRAFQHAVDQLPWPTLDARVPKKPRRGQVLSQEQQELHEAYMNALREREAKIHALYEAYQQQYAVKPDEGDLYRQWLRDDSGEGHYYVKNVEAPYGALF